MELGHTKMIILEACAERSRSWSSLKKLTGLSHTKISSHLKELVTEGYLKKREDGLYEVTEKGLKAVEKYSRMHCAEIAEPQLTLSDVEEFVLLKLKDYEKADLFKIQNPSERLEREFLRILTAKFHITLAKDTELAHLSSHLAKGLNFSLFPAPAPEIRREVIKTSLKLISELMKIQQFRDKVAEHGKMTILITLNLGNTKLPADVKSLALYHIFA